MNGKPIRENTAVRALVVGAALVMGGLTGAQSVAADVLRPNEDAGGPDGGGSGAVVEVEFGQTANERSIALIEGKLLPSGELAGGGPPDFAQTANGRSIAMAEDKLAQGGELAGGDDEVVAVPNLGQPF